MSIIYLQALSQFAVLAPSVLRHATEAASSSLCRVFAGKQKPSHICLLLIAKSPCSCPWTGDLSPTTLASSARDHEVPQDLALISNLVFPVCPDSLMLNHASMRAFSHVIIVGIPKS